MGFANVGAGLRMVFGSVPIAVGLAPNGPARVLNGQNRPKVCWSWGGCMRWVGAVRGALANAAKV